MPHIQIKRRGEKERKKGRDGGTEGEERRNYFFKSKEKEKN